MRTIVLVAMAAATVGCTPGRADEGARQPVAPVAVEPVVPVASSVPETVTDEPPLVEASRPCANGEARCQPVASPGSEQTLGVSDIEEVVRRNRPDVKERCWTALAPPANARARVNVKLTILPSGAVSGVTASGGEDFPTLARCIAGRVRTWVFPRSESDTHVQIPFIFVGS